MASKFRLRYLFKPIVILISKALIKIRVTPNLATVLMLSFSVLSFISLTFFENFLLFSIFVFVTGIMDGCDGAIARLSNKSTRFGGFFDSFMDRLSEFFIFLGLYILTLDEFLWNIIDMKIIVLISFTISIMISYSRARAEAFFKGDFDIGLMARSERLFSIVIISIIGIFFDLVNISLFIFMWLVVATFIFRLIRIYVLIKVKKNQ
ncbi:MAG: CDP-alcohol phosphatidyltransferase family protein [Candidatus Thorarchaeota archaeon]